MIVKSARKRRAAENARATGSKKPKVSVRAYNSCGKCGRTRGYFRFFGLCRICLREEARNARIPGLRKSSW